MPNHQIQTIRDKLNEALAMLDDLESGQAPRPPVSREGVGEIGRMLMDFGIVAASASRMANTFKHLGKDYIERAIAYIKTAYPTASVDERCNRLIACLRDQYHLPDTSKEEQEHQKRLEELRARRERK